MPRFHSWWLLTSLVTLAGYKITPVWKRQHLPYKGHASNTPVIDMQRLQRSWHTWYIIKEADTPYILSKRLKHLIYYLRGWKSDIITRTSEWVITLWRSCELFLCRNISWVRRMCEISLPKTIHIISTDDHHELVLVFMQYYYWLDIDLNGLCI